MSTGFVGEAHPPQGDADSMFTVKNPVPGDELPVAWMVHGLHTSNLIHQGAIMSADVLDQLSFRIGWSRNDNCAGICNRLRDCL